MRRNLPNATTGLASNRVRFRFRKCCPIVRCGSERAQRNAEGGGGVWRKEDRGRYSGDGRSRCKKSRRPDRAWVSQGFGTQLRSPPAAPRRTFGRQQGGERSADWVLGTR